MRGTKGQSTPAASAGQHASVTPGSYYELAIARVRANGGKGVVVTERGTPGPWRAWAAYFAGLDEQTVPRGKKAQTFRSLRNGATVPAEWPIEFDASAPPAPPIVFDPNMPEPMPSPQRRRELAEMLRTLVADWDVSGVRAKARPPDAREARTPDARSNAVAYHEARLAELGRMGPAGVRTPALAAYLERMRGAAEVEF